MTASDQSPAASRRFEAVALAVADAIAAAEFWAQLLDREIRAEPGGALVPGDGTQVGLRFVTSSVEQVGRPWLHLHVTSSSLDDQERIVATALSLGGRHLDVGQGAADDIVLADPGGNELCVIEPGNDYLAGTGRLGEVTCDGTRTVGLFWRDALTWPLVWDQDEETAVQSPAGGTKIAWGGPPLVPKHGPNRQRLELATDDLDAEADRLVALGATRLASYDGRVELADPSDNELWLTRS